jgi:hypothetical protein
MLLTEIFADELDKVLYHISFKKDLEGMWEPKTPAGGGSRTGMSEPDTPRICVSPTIEQCFQAIYPNISKYFEEKDYPHMNFYVYVAQVVGTEEIIEPKDLTKQRLVPDAHLTDEHWILDPTFMQLHSKIRIKNTNDNKWLKFHPYDDKSEKKQGFAPDKIKYKILKEY